MSYVMVSYTIGCVFVVGIVCALVSHHYVHVFIHLAGQTRAYMALNCGFLLYIAEKMF